MYNNSTHKTTTMLDVIYNYQNLLSNLSVFIDQSPFKKEYFMKSLNLSRATFYNKLRKQSFSIPELLKLSTILFPEDTKAYEIKQALTKSREDSISGRVKNHDIVIKAARLRL